MENSPGGKVFVEGNPLRRTRTRVAAAVAVGGLVLAGAGVVQADTVSNTLDALVDAQAEIMPLNTGGANGTTSLVITPAGNDGKNGCNLTGQSTLTLGFSSSSTSVATVSPSTATFTSCGFEQTLTITPVGAGSADVTAQIISNTSEGSFDLLPATFTVNVTAPAPANTAPVLSITGAGNGASYIKGFVPAATCNLTDAEDGPSSFPATLGPISGPDGTTGIGTRQASCSYTDTGGITVAGSVTYTIVDGTAPVVSNTLTPAIPDGSNGWYKNAATLDWTVTEEDSPNSLVLTGCQDQVISADQVATNYSCAAESSGGSAGPATVSLKKDGTAPTAEYTDATGDQGTNGWYTSNVLARFTATDTISGPLTSSQTVPSSGEGANVTVSSPAFTDIAGNTTPAGAASQSFSIDKTAPTVGYVSASPAANSGGWHKTDVEATFSATDLVSGPLQAAKKVTSSGEGAAVAVASPEFEDVAGNVRPADAANATFKIDKTAPTVGFNSVVASGYYGSTAPEPSCAASDTLSGLAGDCVVTGYSTAVGPHILTATATDKAGNVSTGTQVYDVLAWTVKGFYQPVDMNNVLNTVKGGSTVPAKFEVFAGATELTDPGLMGFTAARITCLTGVATDEIETTVAGNTSLRYDTMAGQFIYNWKTPTGAGTCYRLTLTAMDGSSISANFKLR